MFQAKNVCCVILTLGWLSLASSCQREAVTPPSVGDPVNHLVRFAEPNFIAGCFLRPAQVANDAFLGALPYEWLLPPSITLKRLQETGVEELAVFCGPSEPRGDIEWAAAARVSKPVDFPKFVQSWQRSDHLESELPAPAVHLDEFDGREFYKIPGGTFLPPPRKLGKLTLTNRDGEPDHQGIHVGRLDPYRQYIEGETKSSAIFTFESVAEKDLIDGCLPLECNLDVFRTGNHPEKEYSPALIQLRNPDSGLTSEPLRFDARDYVDLRFEIPRSQTVSGSDGRRKVDLLEDLVSHGRLEVVLRGGLSTIYLGVGANDIRIYRDAYEYVYVSGQEMIVASSKETLSRMLHASEDPSLLAGQLAQPNSDFVLAVNVPKESQRHVWENLLESVMPEVNSRLWGIRLAHLTATVRASDPSSARINVQFVDSASAEEVNSELDAAILAAKQQLPVYTRKTLGRILGIGGLLQIDFGGAGVSLPPHEGPGFQRQVNLLQGIFQDVLEKIEISQQGRRLSIDLEEPDRFGQLSDEEKMVIAEWELDQAMLLVEYERFQQSEARCAQATQICPEATHIWVMRAYHDSYQISHHFEGDIAKYSWIRRGIGVFLDRLEQSPTNADILWTLSYFIGSKIGNGDRADSLRQLFSQDEQLQARMSQWVELDETDSVELPVDNWRVAGQLADEALRQSEQATRPLNVRPFRLYLQPAWLQMGYAKQLSKNGRWEEAQAAWQEADKQFNRLLEHEFVYDWGKIRLEQVVQSRKNGDAVPDDKLNQIKRQQTLSRGWLMRCQAEQSENVQFARKSIELARNAESMQDEKLLNYRQGLMSLKLAWQEQPSMLIPFLNEFRSAANEYVELCEQFRLPKDNELAPLLETIWTNDTYRFFRPGRDISDIDLPDSVESADESA